MGLAPSIRTRLAVTVLVSPLAAASTYLLITPAAAAQAASEVLATATNKFEPATLEVPAGTTVTWKNEGGFHTVTGGESSADPASPIGDNALPAAGATVEVTFDKPGTYPYFCQPHVSQGMKGEIVVTAAAGGGAPATKPTTAPTGSGASGAPRPDANPSDADPAKVDPGANQASESAGPGELNQGDEGSVPGSSPEDNKTLREIEEQRAANEGRLGGFDALLAAGTLATIALCVAVCASTRPRRSSR